MLNLQKGMQLKGRYVVHEIFGTGGARLPLRRLNNELKRDVALKCLLQTSAVTIGQGISALQF
jgi:hypothetical protein